MNLEQFKLIFPQLSEPLATEFFDYFIDAFNKYEINTSIRQSAFIGQITHESSNLSKSEENLYYTTPERLFAVYRYNPPGNRFDSVNHAKEYIRNPEKLANHVYSNRYGNGNEQSGDGWRYRGQGWIQTTFKDNYKALSKNTGIDFLSNPEWLQQPKYACLSAAFFFNSHGCNQLADQGEFEKLTERINHAKLGLSDRLNYYKRALKILGL